MEEKKIYSLKAYIAESPALNRYSINFNWPFPTYDSYIQHILFITFVNAVDQIRFNCNDYSLSIVPLNYVETNSNCKVLTLNTHAHVVDMLEGKFDLDLSSYPEPDKEILLSMLMSFAYFNTSLEGFDYGIFG